VYWMYIWMYLGLYLCIWLSDIIIVIYLHFCIFLGLTMVQVAGILVNAIGWTILLGIGRPRDHSAGYPIGFSLVPSVSLMVAWRGGCQVAIIWAKALGQTIFRAIGYPIGFGLIPLWVLWQLGRIVRPLSPNGSHCGLLFVVMFICMLVWY